MLAFHQHWRAHMGVACSSSARLQALYNNSQKSAPSLLLSQKRWGLAQEACTCTAGEAYWAPFSCRKATMCFESQFQTAWNMHVPAGIYRRHEHSVTSLSRTASELLCVLTGLLT